MSEGIAVETFPCEMALCGVHGVVHAKKYLTVAIATTIKGEGAIAAAWTLVTTSTQCRGAAACDGQDTLRWLR